MTLIDTLFTNGYIDKVTIEKLPRHKDSAANDSPTKHRVVVDDAITTKGHKRRRE